MITREIYQICEGHYGIFNGKAAVREFIGSFME